MSYIYLVKDPVRSLGIFCDFLYVDRFLVVFSRFLVFVLKTRFDFIAEL